MTHASNVVLGLIVALFDLILAAIAAIEHALRDALAHAGIAGSAQTAVLAIVFVLLAVLALRLFGRVFALLIVVLLLLLLIGAIVPGLEHAAAPG